MLIGATQARFVPRAAVAPRMFVATVPGLGRTYRRRVGLTRRRGASRVFETAYDPNAGVSTWRRVECVVAVRQLVVGKTIESECSACGQ